MDWFFVDTRIWDWWREISLTSNVLPDPVVDEIDFDDPFVDRPILIDR